MEKDYFDQQNDLLFQFLEEQFSISKARKWEDVAKQITKEKVKKTYKFFAKLYPLKLDYYSELEKSKQAFSSIHWGFIKGSQIIDEVARFSLYSDSITVFHPLQNPVVTSHAMDPRKSGMYWLPDFLEALYFYVVIQKWVKAGIVKLIINPYDYDLPIRDEIDLEVKTRIDKNGFDKYEKAGTQQVREYLAEQFAPYYKGKTKNEIISGLLEVQSPAFSLEEANDFSEVILRVLDKLNPLYEKLNIPLDQAMLSPLKGGGPLESIVRVAEKTGGHIYTPSKSHWGQLQDYQSDDFWTKVGHVYSNISLDFLNSVDTNFALEIRQEDRLIGVRRALKKVFAEMNSITPSELNELKLIELQEELIDEIKKSESDWKKIKTKADIAKAAWAIASVGAPIVTNEMSVMPLLLSSTGLLWSERSRSVDQADLRVKNGVSVFIDAKNQKQGFFSVLRNSIM